MACQSAGAPRAGEPAWTPETDEAVWVPRTDEAVWAPEAGEAAAEVLPFMFFCFEDEEEEDILREARIGASNAEE